MVVARIGKKVGEFCTVIRDEWIEKPKIMWDNGAIDQSCIAQNGNRQWPASVAWIAVKNAVDFFRDADAVGLRGGYVINGSLIKRDLLLIRERTAEDHAS